MSYHEESQAREAPGRGPKIAGLGGGPIGGPRDRTPLAIEHERLSIAVDAIRTPLAIEHERLSIAVDAIVQVSEGLQQKLSPLLLSGPPLSPGAAPPSPREKGPESHFTLALRELTDKLESHARWLVDLTARLDV